MTFRPIGFTKDELVAYMDEKMLNYAKVITSMLLEATDLLEERTDVGGRVHIHCDSDPSGNCQLDVEGWEEDTKELVKRIRQTFREDYRASSN